MDILDYKPGYVIKPYRTSDIQVRLLSEPFLLDGEYWAKAIHIKGPLRGRITNNYCLADTMFFREESVLSPFKIIKAIKL